MMNDLRSIVVIPLFHAHSEKNHSAEFRVEITSVDSEALRDSVTKGKDSCFCRAVVPSLLETGGPFQIYWPFSVLRVRCIETRAAGDFAATIGNFDSLLIFCTALAHDNSFEV